MQLGVAQAIDETRGVVGPFEERPQVRRLVGESLEDGLVRAADDALIDDVDTAAR